MRRGRRRQILNGLACGAIALALASGCKDPDLAGFDPKPLPVAAVQTPDGVTLDENAPPSDVAYAFLRAARDDFLAAQDDRREDQQAAFDLQLQLAAANRIKAAHDQRNARKVAPVRHTREEAVFLVARHWTPIVSHYVDNFADERQAMISRMRIVPRSDDERDVLLDVSRDGSRARVRISLAREQGDDGKKYWRIFQVGYANPQPKRVNVSTPPATTATAPAGS